MRLSGKVVLITGAGRGIGRATALLFASEGARVAIADRDDAAAREVAAEIGQAGGTAIAHAIDVTDRAALDDWVAAVNAEWGQIDVLINNAGITADAQLPDMTTAQFDAVIGINLKGVFQATQAVLPSLLARGKGKILNATSVVAFHGNFGQTNYAAAKAGVIAMTKTWAKELGRKGITVNAVAPGYILTDMTMNLPEKVAALTREATPLGRAGSASDVAKAYLYLASDDADFITGHVLTIDGGLSG